MALNGDTYEKLSHYLGLSYQCVSNKINETNGAEFTQSEISKIKIRYGLEPSEIDEIFFDVKVS